MPRSTCQLRTSVDLAAFAASFQAMIWCHLLVLDTRSELQHFQGHQRERFRAQRFVKWTFQSRSAFPDLGLVSCANKLSTSISRGPSYDQCAILMFM
jgi:hypothetical protein